MSATSQTQRVRKVHQPFPRRALRLCCDISSAGPLHVYPAYVAGVPYGSCRGSDPAACEAPTLPNVCPRRIRRVLPAPTN